jgi:hypothetical protein
MRPFKLATQRSDPEPTHAEGKTSDVRSPIVVAYGAGTNSTAMLVGMWERGECPDLIVFADTGGERPETYAYVETFSAWLVAHGLPPITVVRYKPGTGDRTLEEECLRIGVLPSAARGLKSCSDKWKIRPSDNYVKEWRPAVEAWASGGKVTRLIGYDADEPHRAGLRHVDDRYIKRFPLIEWDWGRDECVAAIERAGLAQPGKSSCFFCPNMSDGEIIDLSKEHPDLFARAGQIEERAAHWRTPNLRGLAREFTFAEVVDGARRQCRLDMPCGCYDGGDE